MSDIDGVLVGGGAFGMFFISGIIGFGVGDYGLFRAYKIIGSRLTMVMTQCLAAPFAATVEWLWLGSSLSLGQVLAGVGILVCLFGLFIWLVCFVCLFVCLFGLFVCLACLACLFCLFVWLVCLFGLFVCLACFVCLFIW